MGKTYICILFIVLWLVACFFIYSQTEIDISNKIQSWAIVTLVFVTIYYAIQTQRIVNEEKKRRIAEFGERRVKEVLYPLGEILLELVDTLSASPKDLVEINEKFKSFDKLHFERAYMLTKQLNEYIVEFRKEFKLLLKSFKIVKNLEEDRIMEKHINSMLEEAIYKLNKETRSITIKIKKTYGYYSNEKIKDIESKQE